MKGLISTMLADHREGVPAFRLHRASPPPATGCRPARCSRTSAASRRTVRPGSGVYSITAERAAQQHHERHAERSAGCPASFASVKSSGDTGRLITKASVCSLRSTSSEVEIEKQAGGDQHDHAAAASRRRRPSGLAMPEQAQRHDAGRARRRPAASGTTASPWRPAGGSRVVSRRHATASSAYGGDEDVFQRHRVDALHRPDPAPARRAGSVVVASCAP